MIYFFNEKVELVDTSDDDDDVLVLPQKRQLNGLITAHAEIKYKKEYEDYTYFGLKKGNNFYIHKIRKRVKRDKILILEGLHIFFYDLKGAVIEDIRLKDKTAEVGFNRILSYTNWELIPTKAGIRASKTFYNVSALEAFNEALNVWDVEFEPIITIQDGKIVKKAVRIVNQLSDDKGKWFEYGDKLLTVEAETNEDDVYTTFIGKGKGIEYFDDEGNSTGGYSRKIEFKNVEWSTSKGDPINKPKGQNYLTLYNPKHSNSDQEQRVTYVEFSDVEDEKILLEKTYQYALKYSRPRVEFSASAIAEEIELGEIVRIIRDDIGIRYKARVFEVEEDFLTHKTMTIKFGDRVTSTISDTIRGTYNEVKSLEELANDRIDKVYEKANIAYVSANGKTTVFRGPERPVANNDGDMWLRILPNDKIRMYVWDEEKNDWISQDLETPDLTEELAEYENKFNEEIDKKITETEDNIRQNIEDTNNILRQSILDSVNDNIEDNNNLLRQSILDSVNDSIDISNFENEFIEIAKRYNKDFTLGDRNLLLDTSEPRTSGNYPITKYELSDEGKKLKSGDEVTITFKVDLNNDEWDMINFYNSGGMVRIGGLKLDELSEEGVGQFTTTWSELEDQEYLNVYYGTWPERDKLTSNTVEWIKLTRGNKASLDHTPAPEDLNNTLIKNYNEIEDNLEIFRQDIGSIERDLKSGDTFQKINSLEKTATETKQTIASIENGLTTEFNKKIENVEGSVTQLGKRVDKTIDTATFEKTINGMKSTLTSVQNDITSLATGGKNFISTDDIVVVTATMDTSKYATMGRVDLSKESKYGGLYVRAEHLEPKTTYILSFNYNKTSGTLVGLGGHTDTAFANNKVKTDGVEQTDVWRNGSSGFVADDENTHLVEVVFTTPSTINKNDKLYIQPNRGVETPVGIKIENLQIRQGDIVLPWVQAPEDVFTKGEMAELEKKVSSIDQDIDSIKSTVSSTKDNLKNITSRVQTAEKEILKISSIEGDVSKLNTRINTAESSISQISKLSNNLNNISSGGYNLISNGKGDNTIGYDLWGSAKLATDGTNIVVTRTTGSGYTGLQTTRFKVEEGRTYTIAFDFWTNADISYLNYNYLMKSVGSNERIDSVKLDDSKTEKRYSITFTAPFTDEKARVMIATSVSTGNEMYFKNIMITESTIPSSFGLSQQELIVESTNTITRTYDRTISNIWDEVNKNQTIIGQTKQEVYSKVSKDEFSSYKSQEASRMLSFIKSTSGKSAIIQTVDSTISSIRDDVNEQNSTITQLSNEISSKVSNKEFTTYRIQEFSRMLNVINSSSGKSAIKQTVEGISTLVTKDNISTSIKQSADDIFMYSKDGSKLTGFKLGADTAELLGDFTVTGDMIVGGVLNAGTMRIINLDASAITTGTISGYNGEWDLTSGRFHTGFKKYVGDYVELYDGSLTAYNSFNKMIEVDDAGIQLYSGTGSGNFVGQLTTTAWANSGLHNVRLGHTDYGTMTISYYNKNLGGFSPYISFDKYNASNEGRHRMGDPIVVREGVYFSKEVSLNTQTKFSTNAFQYIESRNLSFGGGIGTFIGSDQGGLGISKDGNIYKVSGSTWSKI